VSLEGYVDANVLIAALQRDGGHRGQVLICIYFEGPAGDRAPRHSRATRRGALPLL